MKYQLHPLIDVVEDVQSWNPHRSPDETEIDYIDIGSVSQDRKEVVLKPRIMASDAPSRARQLVCAGDILVSTVRPNLNAVARVPQQLTDATASTGFCVLRPKSARLDGNYLFQWVKNPTFVNELMRQATGANYPAVSDRVVLDSRIPLPPLPEQQRIAAILDAADALREKRRQAITKLDGLVQAVFVEMFGDPSKNSRGWTLVPFSDAGTLDRGVSKHRPRNAPELLSGPYPLIQTGEVANSGGYITSYSSTYSELGLRQSKMWPTGTLCITIAANIARTGILTFEACFPDSIVGFTSGENATTEYVQHWLSFLQQELEAQAPQVAQKNINLAILRSLNLPLPPKPLQQRFTEFVNSTNCIRKQQVASLAHLNTLFLSLQQRAFRGEL